MTRREWAGLLGAGMGCGQLPAVERARKASISATMAAMTAERNKIGKGSYTKWFDALVEVRKELRAVMDAEAPRTLAADPATKHYLLRAAGTPPMFNEMYTGEYVTPKVPDAFVWTAGLLGQDAVRATSRWLKKQGIDLLFVPVPKMSDVYMDRIVPRGVPADRLVAPHLRKSLFDLLADDVEVVDLLPAMLKARETAPYPLYLPADSHWSPVGRAVAVRMLAERLARYPVLQAARKAAPMFTVAKSTLQYPMSAMPLLTEEEKAAVEPYLHPEYDFISRLNGQPYGNYESGPVLLIGDSFSDLLGPQLAQAINAPVAMMPVPGGTVQPVKELLRNRSALAEAKVVVWVVNYAIFYLHDWAGLPEVVKREWVPKTK